MLEHSLAWQLQDAGIESSTTVKRETYAIGFDSQIAMFARDEQPGGIGIDVTFDPDDLSLKRLWPDKNVDHADQGRRTDGL